MSEIPGYTYGSTATSHSPVSIEELRKLEAAVGWTEDDAQWLRAAGAILIPQAESMVDSWRAVIGSQPHLLASFLDPEGIPDDQYKSAVKRRFVQWVSDVCLRPHDQAWLDYQEEIGLRHTPAKKNKTDHRHTPPVVPQRYLLGFSAIVITSVGQFLANGTSSRDDMDRTQQAWTRAVLLCITLWSRAYAADGLW